MHEVARQAGATTGRCRIPRWPFWLALPWLLTAGCSPGRGRGHDTLTIGAYSVVREAFHDAILPAFAAEWRRRTGREVRFEESYAASGAQSRAIASGFDADVAVLSMAGDIQRLVEAGLVKKGWDDDSWHGMISRGLVVIGVRPGNPKGIRGWDDLARPGVGVLYPDPKTSGAARWNVNAIWGSGLLRKGRGDPDPDAAFGLLSRVQARVLNMDSSGRQSMATFDRGTGDAVVIYENELLLRQKMTARDVPYVIPPATLLIEGPAAIVDASVERHGNRPLAQGFLDFLRGEEGQRILVEYGFRPLDPRLDDRPLPDRLFTMNDLGGWAAVNRTVYDAGGVWDSLFTQAERGGQ